MNDSKGTTKNNFKPSFNCFVQYVDGIFDVSFQVKTTTITFTLLVCRTIYLDKVYVSIYALFAKWEHSRADAEDIIVQFY